MKQVLLIVLLHFSFCVFSQKKELIENSVNKNFQIDISSIISDYNGRFGKPEEILFLKFYIECGSLKNAKVFKFLNESLLDSALVDKKFYTPAINKYFEQEYLKDRIKEYHAVIPFINVEIRDSAIEKEVFISEKVVSSLMNGINYLTKDKRNCIILNYIGIHRVLPY